MNGTFKMDNFSMSQALLLANQYNLCHVIVKREKDAFCTVFSVFGGTGAPFASPVPFCGVFPTVPEAVESLRTSFSSKVILEGEHLIGIVQYQDSYVVGFVTESEVCAMLPGEHAVRVIKEAKFATISMDSVTIGNDEFEQFDIAEYHYFCETYDVSRPYPSQEKPWDVDPEFCWNLKWRDVFVECGVQHLCISMLQGMFAMMDVGEFHFAYVIRRSSMNPGVRWLGRGFNERGAPGNEVECELIFWHKDGDVWTHVWRRGSVPLKWSTQISSMLTTREDQVVESNFCGSTKRYFVQIHEKYGGVEIYCFCLLKQAKEGPENELFTCYGEAIEIMRRKMGMEFVHYVPFDIYHFFKMDDEKKKATIHNLLELLSSIALEAGFSHRETKQKAIVRINCADSLDRTNMASFFYAMLVVAEWCRRTGLTQVIRTSPFSAEAPEQCIPPNMLDFMARAFVRGGNIISLMYTNTEAQRAEMIWEYAKEKESGTSNLAISLQRRYNNLVTDPERQKNILLWTKNYHAFLPRFLIDHRVLNVVSDGFHASLLQIRGKPEPMECVPQVLHVVLPAGIYCTAIWLYQFPADEARCLRTIKVWGENVIHVPNVSQAMWARYAVPANMNREIRIEFEPAPFIVGKIGFECTTRGFSLPVRKNDVEVNENIYSQLAKDILVSGREKGVFFDVLSDLELIRINNCLTLDRAAAIIADLGINPWYLSPTRYLLKEECCPICRKEFSAQDEQDFVIPGPKFYLSSFYPTRITDMKPVHFPCRVKICDDCIPKASEISQQTKVLESRVTIAQDIPPLFSFHDVDFNMELTNVALAPYGHIVPVSSTYHGDPDSILTNEGGSFEVDSGDFYVVLGCFSEIYRIEFEADHQFGLEMNGNQLMGGLENNVLVFACSGETMEGLLKMHLLVYSPVTLRKLRVLGKPVTNAAWRVMTYMIDYEEQQLERLAKTSFTWDAERRVQVFRAHSKSSQTVDVNIRIPEVGCPSHLIFSFEGEHSHTQHQVRLPKIPGKGRLVYHFNVEPFDHLDVMYCDMVKEVVPLKMAVKEYKHQEVRSESKDGPRKQALMEAARLVGQLRMDLSSVNSDT